MVGLVVPEPGEKVHFAGAIYVIRNLFDSWLRGFAT
jgi:hypothetical protein